MIAPVVALFDANVLYSAPLGDLLICVAREGLVSARWTERIHDEWMRNLLQNRPDLDRKKLQRTRELMDAAIPGSLVEHYEHRIEHLRLPDPDDRHVLAAAIEAKADLIITFNAKDFPRRILSAYGSMRRDPTPSCWSCWRAIPRASTRPPAHTEPRFCILPSMSSSTSQRWRALACAVRSSNSGARCDKDRSRCNVSVTNRQRTHSAIRRAGTPIILHPNDLRFRWFQTYRYFTSFNLD